MRPRPQGLNTGLQTNDDAHFCCLQTSNGVCSTQTYISSTQNTKLLNNRHSLTHSLTHSLLEETISTNEAAYESCSLQLKAMEV